LLREAQPEIVIFCAFHRLVVAAERAHDLGAHHNRAVRDPVAPAQPAAQRLSVGGRVDDAELRAARVDPARAARDERHVRVGVEKRDLALEALGRAQIVGVHARHITPARQLEAPVQRARDAEILVVLDAPDPVVAVAGDQRSAAIGRPVVHDEQLEVRKGLGEHAVDRAGEVALRVPDRKHHADLRHPVNLRHNLPIP
jgi:hypothetical protein